jgi:hypothetical protein
MASARETISKENSVTANLGLLQIAPLNEKHVVGVELQLFFGEELFLVFGHVFEESVPHSLDGGAVNHGSHGAERRGIDVDGNFLVRVDVLDAADKAGHMVKVAVLLTVFVGDGTGYYANLVSLFPFTHVYQFTLRESWRDVAL